MSANEVEAVAAAIRKSLREEAGIQDQAIGLDNGDDERIAVRIARAAIEALDAYRRQNADRDRAHFASELSALAHGGEGS